jgi:hypothetical protein
MRDCSFSAIEDLIRQVERAAAARPNQVRLVAELIRQVADRGADPYLLIGALVEGAVDTLAKHIPPARQGEATEQLGRLLVQRLKARGLAQPIKLTWDFFESGRRQPAVVGVTASSSTISHPCDAA